MRWEFAWIGVVEGRREKRFCSRQALEGEGFELLRSVLFLRGRKPSVEADLELFGARAPLLLGSGWACCVAGRCHSFRWMVPRLSFTVAHCCFPRLAVMRIGSMRTSKFERVCANVNCKSACCRWLRS